MTRPGSSRHGTVLAAWGWLWEGKAKPEQGPFVAVKAADANRSKAGHSWEPEGAGGSPQLLAGRALCPGAGTIPGPGTQVVSPLLFPLFILFINFLELPQ